MAVRYADCTRRQHRNREASETRCAQTADASLSDFGTGDVSPSNGFHCTGNGHVKNNCNCNCRCAELQATATVAARALRANCSCTTRSVSQSGAFTFKGVAYSTLAIRTTNSGYALRFIAVRSFSMLYGLLITMAPSSLPAAKPASPTSTSRS